VSNEVYANGREISCKAGSGKSTAAFPDVCFTPPETPATPPGVPVPYPNTGVDSDTSDGSTTVSVSGQEVMLKDQSYFKKSSGDEAGSATKKGVITSVNRGKIYFNSWSMDVKFEGLNVVRHLDLTTHNHASFPANSATWPFLDAAAFAGTGPCKDVAKAVHDNCLKKKKDGSYALVHFTKKGDVKRTDSVESLCGEPGCKKALECVLSPKEPSNCCPGRAGSAMTGHHIVPKSQFKMPGETGVDLFPNEPKKYDQAKAPCICVKGHDANTGRHAEIHSETNRLTRQAMKVPANTNIPPDRRWDLGDAEATGAQAVETVTGCPAGCTEKQLRNGHRDMGLNKTDKVRPSTAGAEE
jgi:uncharacterized protein DUF4150/HNH/endonuclease VII toxin of polymorphic toxin system